MKRYFYQMKLDDFELGWKDILDEAIENPSNNNVFMFEGNIIYDKDVIFDPVGYYNKLKELYSYCSSRFGEIVEGGFGIFDIKELLKLELMMNCIVEDYTLESEYFDYSSFNPIKIPTLDEVLKDDFFDSYYSYNELDEHKIFK